MKAFLTIGCSASGKSTWAREFIEDNKEWAEVNRDWIRFNIVCPGSDWGSYKFTNANEKMVTEAWEQSIHTWARMHTNIIISDTNLNPKTRDKTLKLLAKLGYAVEIKEFDVSLEELWKRDSLRANGVGHSTIYRQYQQWLVYKGLQETQVFDKNSPTCILVDIDGTIAKMEKRGPFDWHRVGEDSVDIPVKELVEEMSKSYNIVFMSGRDSVCRDETEAWLCSHLYAEFELYMRAESDNRKDTIIKRELFDNHIRGKYNVLFAIDDRPSVCRMWQQLGLKVMNVGNPWLEF